MVLYNWGDCVLRCGLVGEWCLLPTGAVHCLEFRKQGGEWNELKLEECKADAERFDINGKPLLGLRKRC